MFMSRKHSAGKGDTQRPTNWKKWDEGWAKIEEFNKKKKKSKKKK